jgi:large subunit ribosomal protein L9
MEVILCERVPKLGNVGDVVKVKDGYARNFLLRNKLAYKATTENVRIIESQQKKKQAADAQQKGSAAELAEKLGKVSCTINVEVNDLDKLYGSVSEIDIARALEAEGFPIEKKQIVIEAPITELGIFDVGVHLHPEVTAKVRVWVTKK